MYDGTSIVRILSMEKAVVGAGFLVSSKHILTCTHVVNSALGLPIEFDPSYKEVYLDFPSIPTGLLKAKVVSTKPCILKPVNKEEFAEDIAVLELLGVIPSIKPIKLVELNDASDLLGHSFYTMGFPKMKPKGAWVSGKLGRATANWIQIEVDKGTSYKILHGFSGAPVFDKVLNSVVGMVVSAEMEQRETKVAFMIPSYILTKSNSLLERETLVKVLDRIILIDEVAAAIENYKKGFIEDTRDKLRQRINSMDTNDVFTLYLMIREIRYRKVSISQPKEYGKVLLKFVNGKDKSYEGKNIQVGITTDTLEVLRKVILEFYTSWKIKRAVENTLANINSEKIRQAVDEIAPYRGDSKEVADKIHKLLKNYEMIGFNGKVVDDAFISSVLKILNESGIYTLLSVTITTVFHYILTNFLHMAVGGLVPWLLPVAISVLVYQAFTFKENLANKVSSDVADKVSLEFRKFNLEISKNIKSQVIKSICSMI